MSRRAPIAIVGMACRYPDARSPRELWENVIAQRQSFRLIPSERLNYQDYFSNDRTDCDKVYAFQAAVIEGYEFDRHKFNISGSTYRSVDLAHWLALDVASGAIDDAGFLHGNDLPKGSTGVIVGNTLTGEFSRTNLLRTRWPYVRRTVDHELARQNWDADRRGKFLDQLEESFKSPFPRGNEETLAGGLSNTIAGRICNYFDLKGGGFIVDGACASSLLAVAQACSMLAAGDLDMALAGGVDLSIDPFELVGFARAGALAEKEMRVFDAQSAGFWPGEGCGFLTLMREEDAIKQGKRIYSTIRGWGISSDGAGGMTRPEVEGQSLALKRAYDGLEFGIEDVAYFECHGTGTAVGDGTELRALSAARKSADQSKTRAAVGSVKANIGHTKAAAGVAGVIKTVMALQHATIPPTAGCKTPNAQITAEDALLRVVRRSEAWPAEMKLRAGVSGFGFGGINSHLALELKNPIGSEITGASATQDCELFLFDASDSDMLHASIEQVHSIAPRLSRAELSDLSALLASKISDGAMRAAVVADTPAKLAANLEIVLGWLLESPVTHFDSARGAFLGINISKPRIGFLFPGQGSAITLNGGAVAERFASARKYYAAAHPSNIDSPAVIQPAVVRASLAGSHVLHDLGIEADIAIGHSLGELSAMQWAGAFDEESLLGLAKSRGQIIADHSINGGAMASIGATREAVLAMRNGEHVAIACHNGPRNTVISGLAREVDIIVARAKSQSLSATVFRTTHAFHSPLVEAAAEPFRSAVDACGTRTMSRAILSTITGKRLSESAEIPALLARQLTAPVLFAEAINSAAEDVDLFIEVGAGDVLGRLVGNICNVPTAAVNVGGESLSGLLGVAGAAFAIGAKLNRDVLFGDRFVREFNLDWQPKFFANPCESAPAASGETRPVKTSRQVIETVPHTTESPLEALRNVIAAEAELSIGSIHENSHLLRDLHLNSIKVAEIVALTCRRLDLPTPLAPTEMSTATVAQVAEALSDQKRVGTVTAISPEPTFPSGIDTWVRAFRIKNVARPLANARARETAGAGWQVFGSSDQKLLAELNKAAPEGGIVLILPAEPDQSCINIMLAAAQTALGQKRFVVVHNGRGGASLAKTVFLESSSTDVCAIEIPAGDRRAIQWIVDEAAAANGFVEVTYDCDGVRSVPVAEMLPLRGDNNIHVLGADDVLLVTGGGKGIAAECALSLAQSSGAKLIILGRSEVSADRELSTNLSRLEKHGIQFGYHAADVTDTAAVINAVRRGQERLGAVTAILHGAGTNVPALLQSLDESAFLKTLNPKVQGLKNLLLAIDPARLRLLVTFGSIIARTGMRGETDYAVSNDWLGRFVDEFSVANPKCRCINLEWSIWSGVGMGQRLGSITPLMAQGIAPISPDAGMKMLGDLLRDPTVRGSVIVAGRFGNPPTLAVSRELPRMRFLQTPRCFYPDVELVADVRISVESDPYLADHVFRGRCLLPGVVGLEIMAQAAMAVAGWDAPPVMVDVRFDRPIEVPIKGDITLRAMSLVMEDGSIQTAVRSSATNFAVNHFSAIARKTPDRILPLPNDIEVNGEEAALIPATDLYGPLLFHGPQFHQVKSYPRLRAKECIVEISGGDADGWILGDAIRRDAAIHAIQACIPHKTILPTAIGCVNILSANSGPCRLIARESSSDDTGYIYDLWIVSPEGQLLEQWTGLRLQMADVCKLANPLPVGLLQPYLQRRVCELLPDARFELETDRTAIDHHRPDGKPDRANYSRSNFAGRSISATSAGPVGIDAEAIIGRTSEQWRALLNPERMALAQQISKSRPESLDRAAGRVWCAAESLLKLSLPPDVPLTFDRSHGDGWTMLQSGTVAIATFVSAVREISSEIGFAIACAKAEPKSFDSPQVVGFDEVNRMGTVNFTAYFHWQARAREAFLRAFAPSVMRELHDGAVLVTTAAACEYKADINPEREVILRMKLKDLGVYNVTMDFDYLQLRDGKENLVATGHQTIASMIRSTGNLVATPLPQALREALMKFADSRQSPVSH